MPALRDREGLRDELDLERQAAERLAVDVEEEDRAGALVLEVERSGGRRRSAGRPGAERWLAS